MTELDVELVADSAPLELPSFPIGEGAELDQVLELELVTACAAWPFRGCVS